jgi:hypothetical protein
LVLITDVGDYIEFYNHRRFHETLVYKKPMNVYQESIKLNQEKAKANSDALLVSNVDYALNAGNLIISARVSLYPKATNLKKFMKNSKNENTFDITFLKL